MFADRGGVPGSRVTAATLGGRRDRRGRATEIEGWVYAKGTLAEPAPEELERVWAGELTVLHPRAERRGAGTTFESLRRAASALERASLDETIGALSAAAAKLRRDLDEPAVALVAENAGLSPAMVRETIRGMARSWTASALERLVRSEFPDPRALDRFVAEEGRAVRARAVGATVHFGSGTVPGATIGSIMRATLVRAPLLVKPGLGDVALTTRFVRAFHAVAPALAPAVAVRYWPGGADRWAAWERDVVRLADQVVVYGSDRAIESIRRRAPASTRLVEHPNRIGVVVVDPKAGDEFGSSAPDVARAVALFDQRGCVSAHLVLFVGERRRARRWCEALARSLDAAREAWPPGRRSAAERSASRQLEGALAIGAAAGASVEAWSCDRGDWTVALAPADRFAPVGGRAAWVVPVDDWRHAAETLRPLAGRLQTVGVAGAEARRGALGAALAELGATRIARLADVPFPEADWLHDGRRPLRELVRWTEAR